MKLSVYNMVYRPQKSIGESRFADCLVDGKFAGSADIDSGVALLKLFAMLISTPKIKQMPTGNPWISSAWRHKHSGPSFVALLFWHVIETSP